MQSKYFIFIVKTGKTKTERICLRSSKTATEIKCNPSSSKSTLCLAECLTLHLDVHFLLKKIIFYLKNIKCYVEIKWSHEHHLVTLIMWHWWNVKFLKINLHGRWLLMRCEGIYPSWNKIDKQLTDYYLIHNWKITNGQTE